MAYEIESPLFGTTSGNNNSTALADRLVSGEAMSAALSSASDVDYFRIDTSSASVVSLDFTSPLLTTAKHWQLRLLNTSGDYLQTTAGSVQGTPLVNGSNQSGTALNIDGVGNAPQAGTRFTFVTTAADTTVYTVVSATPLSGGGTTLTLDRALPSGLADNTPLAFDAAQVSTGVSTSLNVLAPSAGSYYAQVLVDGTVYNGSAYSISARVTPTVESEGFNGNGSATNTSAQNLRAAVDANNRLLANTTMTGALSSATDVDTWVFTTARPSDFAISFGSSSTSASSEWRIDVTEASGAPLQGGSLTAGTSASLSVDDATFPTAKTFLVKVSATSSTVFNTGSYTLKVAGAGLDLNDAPVLTVGTVSSGVPNFYPTGGTGVVRSIPQGSTTGTRIDSLFTAADADAGQSVTYYRLSLTKEDGVASDAVIRVGSGSTATNYGFATGAQSSASVALTAEQMSTAVFLPGSTPANTSLTLTLQAYDSTSTASDLGGVDDSGASAILPQTLRIVSASAGVSVATTGMKTSLSENVNGQGAELPHTTTFKLKLNEVPTTDVKVFLSDVNDQLDLRVNGQTAQVVTFTAANFNVEQTVTVEASTDSRNEGAAQTANLTFLVVSEDVTYDGLAVPGLSYTIADNAAPVFAAAPAALSYADTPANDTFATPSTGSVSGTVTASDANADTVTYGVQGGTAGTGADAGKVLAVSSFGTLAINPSSGAYEFRPNAAGLNVASSVQTQTFTLTATDGSATGTTSLSVSVAGADDRPTATFTAPIGLVEAGGTANGTTGTPNATSTFTATDAEGGASLDTAAMAGIGWSTTNNGTTYTQTGIYGRATLTTATRQVAYALDDNDAETQALRTGDTRTESLIIPFKDAGGTTGTATLSLAITGANDAPAIASLPDLFAVTGQSLPVPLVSYLSDPDSLSGELTTLVTDANGEPLPSWITLNPSTKTLTLAPTATEVNTTITVAFKVVDNAGAQAVDTFEVSVGSPGLEAVLVADAVTGNEDIPVTGNVLGNDVAPGGTTLAVVRFTVAGDSTDYQAGQSATVTGLGQIALAADGAFTFTPAAHVNGDVPRITYVTNAANAQSTLDITLRAVDDAPVMVADRANVTPPSPTTGNVLANDSDIDSTLLVTSFTVAGIATPFQAGATASVNGKGSLQLLSNGSFTFNPEAGFSGAYPQVTYITNTAASSTLDLATGIDVSVQAYTWKTHALLPGVNVALGSAPSLTTSSSGAATFSSVTDTTLTVTASRTVPGSEAAATNAAVNLQDAIAILKMIVGLEVNGAGKPLSPYQSLAADFDGNGSVNLTDAINVLKHVVGLTAPAPAWVFVDEAEISRPAKANLTPGTVPSSLSGVAADDSLGLVGVLRGDVDGSWANPQAGSTLPTSYFQNLVAELNANSPPAPFSLSQWGVYS